MPQIILNRTKWLLKMGLFEHAAIHLSIDCYFVKTPNSDVIKVHQYSAPNLYIGAIYY